MAGDWLVESDCLVSLDAISSALDELAFKLNREYGGADFEGQEVLALCVLNGGVVFAGHILPRLTMRVKLDYIHCTRYRGELTGSDDISWFAKPRSDLAGQHILVLDDIFDEGRTLEAIVAYAEQQGAKSVTSAVMANKLHNRKPEQFKPDYSGVDLPDRYVFGMGMDRHGLCRNAPGIYALKGE